MNLCKDRLKHWRHKKVVPLDAAMEETVAAPEENGGEGGGAGAAGEI